MPYPPKIVLNCTSGSPKGLAALVEAFLSDGVKFVGVAGTNAAGIEDQIDDLVVGDGSDDGRFLLTSNHEGESLQDAINFADLLTGEYAGAIQVVEV